MSTPTDQQQIRATIRRAAKELGDLDAILMAVETMVGMYGERAVSGVAKIAIPSLKMGPIPPLMGTAEVAAAFGIANSNISKLPDAVRPIPCQRISNGTTPVYLASEVMAKAAQYRPRTRA